MGYRNPTTGRLASAATKLFSPFEQVAQEEIRSVTRGEQQYAAHAFSNPTEHEIALAHELNESIVMPSSNGQQFSGLWLNRNVGSEQGTNLLVLSNSFLTDATQIDTKIRAFEVARLFPKKEILLIDQPSHGHSSNVTPEQRKAFALGDMTEVGQEQYDAIVAFSRSHLKQPLNSFDIKGESLGSRQALEIIRASIQSSDAHIPQVGNFVAFEIPGTEPNRRIDIHASYFLYEALRSGVYGAPWIETYKQSFASYLATYSGAAPEKPAAGFLIKDKRMAVANFWDSTLGHGTGNDSLRHALEHGVAVNRVVGEVSKVDRLVAAKASHELFVRELGRTFCMTILRYESHDGTGTLSRARLAAVLLKNLMTHMDQASQTQIPLKIEMADIQKGKLPYSERQKAMTTRSFF